MNILHCSQCHWSNPVAAFYVSVTESEKGESGAGKKKKEFVFTVLCVVLPFNPDAQGVEE